MPKMVSKYRIFVASPSDVLDERAAVNEVIDELNISYGSPNNIVLELVKWETHSAPGISTESVQDIINKDISLEYDLFVGIIWKKFGTPTSTAESGTEEEFNHAYQKYTNDQKSVQILFYFKTAGTQSINDIDPNQLIMINKFKDKISNLNTLYWEFKAISELQRYLRMHIPKRIHEMIRLNEYQPENIESLITPSVDLQEELGLLDYQEIREEALEDANEALTRIADATGWVGTKITEKTAEINKALNAKKELSNKEIKDFSSRVALVMEDYASRIEPEIPIFISAFEKAGDAMQNIILLRKDGFMVDKESDIVAIDGLINGARGSKDSMSDFLSSINSLPRMSKELNKARRNVEGKLDMLISKLEYCEIISQEIKQSLLAY